ncbi:MAG: hypothetical protein MRERV_32c044 [Mycoplasmataceae bacterium RV_VA103A]|nr:MAG: hypothetical protein MRERV_32c044 [Mycoplasmataceae bacterium RV_VA103A]
MWVSIFYDFKNQSVKSYQKFFSATDNPAKEKISIENCCKSITREIMDDINNPRKARNDWVFEKTYKVCLGMICGTNPCSCEE